MLAPAAVKRLIEPAEVAELVAYLCGDARLGDHRHVDENRRWLDRTLALCRNRTHPADVVDMRAMSDLSRSLGHRVTDATPMLRTRGLAKEFNGFRAVNDVDLDVAAGTVHALVGPNGAGKTTLFNLLTGFLAPDRRHHRARRARRHRAAAGADRAARGRPLVPDHQPVRRADAHRARRAGAAGPGRHRATASGGPTGSCAATGPRPTTCSSRSGSPARADEPAGSLAYGQKRALELALALALSPRLLLLDEPTAGMGVEDVARTVELIRRVRADRTVVLVEHNMKVVGDLTDRVTVLQFGKVLAEGPYERGPQRPAGDHRLPGRDRCLASRT